MKKSRFTQEQRTFALRQAERGTPVAEVCRQVSVNEASFYIWMKKCGQPDRIELRELRQLRDEKARLKRLAAGQAHPRRRGAKTALTPARRRALAGWIQERYKVITPVDNARNGAGEPSARPCRTVLLELRT